VSGINKRFNHILLKKIENFSSIPIDGFEHTAKFLETFDRSLDFKLRKTSENCDEAFWHVFWDWFSIFLQWKSQLRKSKKLYKPEHMVLVSIHYQEMHVSVFILYKVEYLWNILKKLFHYNILKLDKI